MPNEQKSFYSNIVSTLVQTTIGTRRDDSLTDTVRKSWRRRIGGTLLLAMYALVFYVVIMSLTAYQIQTRVHATNINTQEEKQTIWSVTRIADRVLSLDNDINDLNVKLSILQEESVKSEKNVILAPINAPKIEESTIVAVEHELLLKEINKIEITIEKFTAQRDKKLQKTADLIDELQFFHRSSDSDSGGILDRGLNFFFGGSGTSGKSRSPYLFVTLPSEVLIMLVVIAMGSMGSMISITQVFFAGEDRPVTFYLFRPLLGAVVAIGIYVITKAGVIVASNLPVQADGAAKLNAFFVSFISLIAGLMSEGAINTIKRAGTSFLRGDPVTETARYANGVAAAMTADSKNPEDLYPFFDVADDVVDKWLAETERVPGDSQRVIAAWLEKPVRNLFSDLPPYSRGGGKADAGGNADAGADVGKKPVEPSAEIS